MPASGLGQAIPSQAVESDMLHLNLLLPLSSQMTMGDLLNLAKPQFSHP